MSVFSSSLTALSGEPSSERALKAAPLLIPHGPPTPPITLSPDDSHPAVRRVIDIFRKRQLGQTSEYEDSPWIKFKLSPRELDDLELQLRADEDLWGFVEDKLRYDLDYHHGEVTIRMPTGLHEIFLVQVRNEIRDQLKDLATQEPLLAPIIDKIGDNGSTDVRFKDDGTTSKSKRSPDGSLAYEGCRFPNVVLEVSYSQKRKDLDRLADDYVMGSNGNTQLVVGLDIEYQGTKAATVSVWRPAYVTDEQGNFLETKRDLFKVFRNEDGTTAADGNLTIALADLVPEAPAPRGSISISFAKLTEFLNTAESRYTKLIDDAAREKSLPPGYLKRPRQYTPPEQLSEEREAKFTRLEERDASRDSDVSFVDEGDEDEDG